MAADVTAGPDRSPARVFMAFSAAYHLPLAIVGLALDQTFPIGTTAAATAESEHVFGIFETNGWHSFAALLVGGVSLYYALRPKGARATALALGIGHVGIVVALTIVPPWTFRLASNGADQVIHSITAIGGIGSALMTRTMRTRASVWVGRPG